MGMVLAAALTGALTLVVSAGELRERPVLGAASCPVTAPPPGLPADKIPAWQSQQTCRYGATGGGKANVVAAPAAGPSKLSPPANARQIGTQAQLGGVPIPFSPAATTITNMYFDLAAGDTSYLGVYGGALNAAPTQGVIFVSSSSNSGQGGMIAYPLPRTGGIATLISLAGPNVTVGDTTGDRFVFNTTTLAWQ